MNGEALTIVIIGVIQFTLKREVIAFRFFYENNVFLSASSRRNTNKNNENANKEEPP